MALGDLFNTGREEALVNNMTKTPSLYYNSAPVGNFISLRLIGGEVKSGRLGAKGYARTRRRRAPKRNSQW